MILWQNCALHVSYGYSILKTIGVVFEVIRLDVFFYVIFIPYYDSSPTLWEVVANSNSSFWLVHHIHKGCLPKAVHGLLPSLTHPKCYTRLPMAHLVTQVTRGLPDTVTRAEVLTYLFLEFLWNDYFILIPYKLYSIPASSKRTLLICFLFSFFVIKRSS